MEVERERSGILPGRALLEDTLVFAGPESSFQTGAVG